MMFSDHERKREGSQGSSAILASRFQDTCHDCESPHTNTDASTERF